MLAFGNFKSGISTPKDSLWQKVHVSLRGLPAICNKIQLKDAYNNKDIISSHMKSKVGSFSGSLSRGVGPFRLFAGFVFKLNRSHQMEVTILNINANMTVSTSRNMITQLCPFMNQQNSGLLPTKAYLLHISLAQDYFMHPCLKSWQRKQATVNGSDQPANSPGDGLSLSTLCSHCKKMVVLLERRVCVWRRQMLGGPPLVSAIVQKASLMRLACAEALRSQDGPVSWGIVPFYRLYRSPARLGAQSQ